ncbi:3-oxoacyl-[acyl-carrier-protein] synthase III C-terminal domain-containing protein [Enterococcus sp. BWR-S5]|uniref:3-oxoacyl-[acyl-carrier-protein] synthase III C-terminal domain-containing protein n=1 Tax=Enterococcus sp. BWR-S5 TaxID=2787714 RepID=UPI001921F8D0|nr:3-oxoacyl-[acyl-carrier-protein] synthase III C-terminal domain-containing protein [Enterococcus sp. BWR-S5]MBL1226365.1 3-oxoacyl-ACP synthase [Enterococcus sp. BWR-S5]
MNGVEITGYGTALPKNTVTFGDQTRYRVVAGETQISLAVEACEQALRQGNLDITEIDCLVSASAVAVQPIPCTAALIHEQIAQGTDIPAIDINTTCTSFVTALDTFSTLIEAGRYTRVLIVSSEVGSLGLNPNQKESFELFSDGAAAIVLERSTNPEKGVISAMQRTWSEGAHQTEIRGGLTAFPPSNYSEETKEEYMFDMQGKAILSLVIKKLPKMMAAFYEQSGLSADLIDKVVPHQASRAMPLLMKKIGFSKEQYFDTVKEYGNMVSASIPFTLCNALSEQAIKDGDTVLFIGTAAGLTTNILAMRC